MGTLLLDLLLGFGIGGSLGLLGGGGSILTVPALVYLVGQTPQAAITTSLVIVGMNSALGAAFHRVQGTLNWRVALLFGGSGMVVSYLAAGFSNHISPSLLLVVFAALMLLIGALLIFRKQATSEAQTEFTPSLWKIVGGGLLVGLLTGILGVGGGFLIVPALVLITRIPMKIAVGTSLAIVAAKSYAGFAGYLGAVPIDWALMGGFTAVTVAASFAGTRIAHRFSQDALKRGFAVFLLFVASYILLKSVIGG